MYHSQLWGTIQNYLKFEERGDSQEKRQFMEINAKMTQMLALADNKYKVTIIIILNEV